MSHLLGIDLGTSSVKATVIDERGTVMGTGMQEYPILTPQPGWAEQDPEGWWRATTIAVQEAVAQADEARIKAVGLSGQMHGLVLIDKALQPIAPAIIWADQRSTHEVDIIRETLGADALRTVGTLPSTGFYGASLLWLLRHQPATVNASHLALLPKDYLRLKLTGEAGTEASDASSTGLFDIQTRQWYAEGISRLGLPSALLPRVQASAEVVGQLTPASAAVLNLTPGIPVVAGCADQVAQAIGNGLTDPGRGSVTIGTGGQLFAPLASSASDSQLRLHTFCHAPADRWYLLGATLSAGLSLRWLRNLLGEAANPDAYQQLAEQAAEVTPGADGLLFLPYLIGERAPVMDPLARGAFVGLTLRHGRGHLVRAIMEGVCFALRQVLDVMDTLHAAPQQLLASGNGLVSPVWRQIAADTFARPLSLTSGGERAGIGAALVAGIGAGVYGSYAEAIGNTPAPSITTEPDPVNVSIYAERYALYAQMYPLLKALR
jgi:xylulokinase